MIIKGNKIADVQSLGEISTTEMSIDLTNKRFIMDLLSEGIYSDSLGSLIRELSSNSIDAVRELGSDTPVVVRLGKDNNFNWVFSVTDYGVGISSDRMQNVVSKYFGSTKRESNDFIGAIGAGFKSPLSYVDSFIIITVSDGVKYKYMMYKSEEGSSIDLLHSEPTEDRNGTTIEVSVKNEDVYNFKIKIKEQLAYFEGVYFDVEGISNDFKIVKADNWKYSELNQDSCLHMTLDNVYYPLDFNKLGINPIHCPIALRFELTDGIYPTPSRETIRLTEETKKLILDKIGVVATEMIERYNKKCAEVDNIRDIYSEIGSTVAYLDIEGHNLQINDFVKYSSTKIKQPSVKGAEDLDLHSLKRNGELARGIFLKGYINQGKFTSKTSKYYDYILNLQELIMEDNMILVDEDLKGVKMEYVKSTFTNTYLIRYTKPVIPLRRRSSTCYYNLLELHKYPKDKWRSIIIQYNTLIQNFIDGFKKVSEIEVDKTWLEERKNNRKVAVKVEVDKGEINPKVAIEKEVGTGYCFKPSDPITLSDLNSNILNIYGTDDQRHKLIDLAWLLHKSIINNRCNLMVMVKRDIDRVQDISNFISYKEFMTGKTELFQKYATSLLIGKLVRDNEVLFHNIAYITSIDEELGKKLHSINNFYNNLTKSQYNSDAIKDSIIEVATETNAWFEPMYTMYNEVVEALPDISFISNLKRRYSYEVEMDTLAFAKEVYNLKKVNNESQVC